MTTDAENSLEKTDQNGLFRDRKSGAILNTDKESLAAYKAKKKMNKMMWKMQSKIEYLEQKVHELESQMHSNKEGV